MPTLKELKEKRQKLLTDAHATRTKAETEKRDITKDEMSAAMKMLDDAEEVRKEIDAMETREANELRLKNAGEEIERELRGRSNRQTDPDAPTNEGNDNPNTSAHGTREYRSALNAWYRGGTESLSPEQRSTLQRGARPWGEPGERASASSAEQRNLQSGVNAQGGFLVAPNFSADIQRAQQAFMGIEVAGAQVLPTDTGAALPFPTNNDTANRSRIVAETGVINTNATTTFGQVSIPVYMYTTDYVLVSLQMLADAAFPVEQFIQNMIAERQGRGLNADFTNGTGTNEPYGFARYLLDTAAARINTTAAATLAADDFIKLQHAVDPAYRNNPRCKYLFADLILQAIRLMKDSQGRYLFQDARDGAPSTVAGKPYEICTEMSGTVATGNVVAAFGDPATFKIRRVNDMLIQRDPYSFMRNGQVGFVMLQRHGGGYVNPGNYPLKGLRVA